MNDRWHEMPEREPAKGAALIDKAFRLIDIVGAAPGHVGIQQFVHETGWARATLYRILSAITANGYLRLDPVTQGYTLGYRFLELAQNVWSGPDLAAIASVELRRLRDMTGETAYLAVPHDGAMLALGKFEGTHPVRSAARLGIRKPMHCTSQGKAVLAFLDGDDVDRLLGRSPLEQFTEKTITDPALLKPHLSIARQRGYAIEDEEIITGNRCVGAPILDTTGKPLAAISVAGPIWRLTNDRVEQLGPEVALVARHISAQLRGAHDAAQANFGISMAHPAIRKPAFYGADPVWDKARNILIWTDRLGPVVFETGAKQAKTVRLARESPIEVAFSNGGSLTIWQADGKCSLWDGKILTEKSESSDSPLAVAVDSKGSVWTAMATGERCAIFQDGEVTATWTLSGRISAMAWAPDDMTLFAADPGKGTIYALLKNSKAPRILCRIPRVSGEPRALTTDRRGRLWLALYDGWSVARLSAEGEIEHVVALPVPRPTGIAAGGDTVETLYITTARAGLTREVIDNAPLSGQLLVLTL